ncbi:MAG: acyl-CoA thioesterase [Deltaproteobacteria bacterium]|nr:acyl-CoA thioesterase [Deltaproteobacteria bacterium]MBW2307348.1 acyl-CoA thioesterase [Deltaproteobacteria bacterium]
MKKYETTIRVRYQETDKMGFVYYANYLIWFEVARTELLEGNGIPYTALEQEGIFLPAKEAGAHYIRPACYGDTVRIFTTIGSLTRAKIECFYRAVNQDDELLVTGRTLHVFTGADGQLRRISPQRLSAFQKALAEYREESPPFAGARK